jgi:hypothetical protein
MSDELPDKYEPPKNEYLVSESPDNGSIGRGIGYTLLLHLFQLPMALVFSVIMAGGFLTVFFIGLSQLVYMIPFIIYFKKQGETKTSQGLIIGASITFLLNAACTGLVFSSF